MDAHQAGGSIACSISRGRRCACCRDVPIGVPDAVAGAVVRSAVGTEASRFRQRAGERERQLWRGRAPRRTHVDRRGVADEVGAGRAMRRHDHVDRGGAALRRGSPRVPGQPADHRVRARRKRHRVPAVSADPRHVAVPASVRREKAQYPATALHGSLARKEVQPSALNVGHRSSWQTEVSVNLAARPGVATSRNQQRDDHCQRDPCSHTAQIARCPRWPHRAPSADMGGEAYSSMRITRDSGTTPS